MPSTSPGNITRRMACCETPNEQGANLHFLPSPAPCPTRSSAPARREPFPGGWFRRRGILHPGPAQARSWPSMQPHGAAPRGSPAGIPGSDAADDGVARGADPRTNASRGAPAGQFPQPRGCVINGNQSCRRPGQHQPGDSWTARVGTFRDTVPGDGAPCQEAGLGLADGGSANLHWPPIAPGSPGTQRGPIPQSRPRCHDAEYGWDTGDPTPGTRRPEGHDIGGLH